MSLLSIAATIGTEAGAAPSAARRRPVDVTAHRPRDRHHVSHLAAADADEVVVALVAVLGADLAVIEAQIAQVNPADHVAVLAFRLHSGSPAGARHT